jgi:hypothetical protein
MSTLIFNRRLQSVSLGEFSKEEWELLYELVEKNLQEIGINPACFAFSIEVDYTEKEQGEV